MGISYKECLRNHAASLGGHAIDGCGEFMASPAADEADPSSLLCAACRCHRNFHRLYNPCDDPKFLFRTPTPSPPRNKSPPPPRPPTYVASPVPRSYFASGPHMLYNLSTGGFPRPSDLNMNVEAANPTVAVRSENSSRGMGEVKMKRARTKFTADQIEKMKVFAAQNGWMIRSCDETALENFCREAGIKRAVFKVWMHNNKIRMRGPSSYGGADSIRNVAARVSGDGSSTS